MSSRTFAVIAGTVGLVSASGVPKAVREKAPHEAILGTNGEPIVQLPHKLPNRLTKAPTLGGKGGGKGRPRFAPKPPKGAKKPGKTAPAEDDSSVAKDQRKPQKDQQAGRATGRAPGSSAPQRAAKPRQGQ